MMHRHKHSWSHNELFAHKKNVGEQAKLKDTMLRIERKFGYVKDAIKMDTAYVKTSLKLLRKSTGHSIEALPPTPFQLNKYHRDNTFATEIMPPLFRTSPNRTVNPEFEYLLDEMGEQGLMEDNLISDDKKYMREISGTDSKTMERDLQQDKIIDQVHEDFVTDPTLIKETCFILDNKSQNTKDERFEILTEISKSPEESPSSKSLLPPIQNDNLLLKTRQGNEFMPVPADSSQLHTEEANTNNIDKQTTPMRNNLLIAGDIQKLTIVTSIEEDRNATDETNDKELTQTHFSFLSKEDSTLTSSSPDRKIPSGHIWSSTLTSMHNSHSQNMKNRKKDAMIIQRRKDAQNRTLTKEKAGMSQMADTRARCRTCAERYRQNVEFQRQKKLLEQDQENQSKNLITLSRIAKFGGEKSFLAKEDDLNSIFAESEVLDFEEHKPSQPVGFHNKKNDTKQKGYSKARLQQLAEPRKGRRKKMLFSKHVIKKEVDDLMERHSQPLLTEKEKERVRILESKIRMFLAVTSATSDAMPTTMVHIPQREDIMTVDISHH